MTRPSGSCRTSRTAVSRRVTWPAALRTELLLFARRTRRIFNPLFIHSPDGRDTYTLQPWAIYAAGIPRKQFQRSILVTSSPTRATSSRGCYTRMSRVSGDFPFSLPRAVPDWSAGGLLRCSAARLSVCRVVLQKSTSTTRTTCCGQVASIIV